MEPPRFAAALATEADTDAAERSVVRALSAGLGGPADLVVAFATPHHGARYEGLVDRLAERLGASTAIGCSAESVIGPSREAERERGLAVFAARLPGTELAAFHARAVDSDDSALGAGVGNACFAGVPPTDGLGRAGALLLGEPYTLPVEDLLEYLGAAAPELAVVGAMASGGGGPGTNLLLTRDGVVDHGGVGVLLHGATGLIPVVSQGCRPVGQPWVITAARENVILELGGRPAFDALMATMRDAPRADRELLQRAPFVGVAVDPSKSEFGRGDFLVRGLMGVQPQERAVVVADLVRRGQTVQFLARDAASAGEDLELLLAARAAEVSPRDRAGALLFTCNGRGTRMFDEPDHDLSRLRRALGGEPQVAGFFANGELGPIGGRNHLHGFTASVALFGPTGP